MQKPTLVRPLGLGGVGFCLRENTYTVVMKSFTEKVYEVVRGIPKGKVMTYVQVAQAAGSPKAFRAVGNILNKNYDPKIPCHRVVKADGGLGNYNRGADKKARLLKEEGYVA